MGTRLSREPWQTALLQIFQGVGGRLHELGVPEPAQFDAASALVNYVLGVAGQNAANAGLHAHGSGRAQVLGKVAAEWAGLDPVRYPFVRRVAARMPEHDDREQFLAGIGLILVGIAALR